MLANIPNGVQPDSIRLHIPRALRTVYDVRNNRDTAHLADGINPNLQDATLVVGNIDWVLAEFVRLHHNIGADAAQALVNSIVSRQAPVVQEFGGFLKVLRKLDASDHLLVQLYQRGDVGASLQELLEWARPNMRKNLRRTLDRLVDDEAFVHFDGQRYKITFTGQKEVEERRLQTLA